MLHPFFTAPKSPALRAPVPQTRMTALPKVSTKVPTVKAPSTNRAMSFTERQGYIHGVR